MTARTNNRAMLSCKPVKMGYSEINKTIESRNRMETQMLEFQRKHLELSKHILSTDMNKAQETMRKKMERLKIKLEDSKKRRKEKDNEEKIRAANEKLKKSIDSEEKDKPEKSDLVKKQTLGIVTTPPNSVTFGSNQSFYRNDINAQPRNNFMGDGYHRNNGYKNWDKKNTLDRRNSFSRDIPRGLRRNNSFHGSITDIPSRPGSRSGNFHNRSNSLPLSRSDGFYDKPGPRSISSIRSSKSSSSGSSGGSVYKVKRKRVVHYNKFEVIDAEFPLTAPEAISSVRRQRDSLLSSRSRHLKKAMNDLETAQKSHREEENEMYEHLHMLEEVTGLTLNIKKTPLSPRIKETGLGTPLPPSTPVRQQNILDNSTIKLDPSPTSHTSFNNSPGAEMDPLEERLTNVSNDGDQAVVTTPAQLKVHLALPNITLQNKDEMENAATEDDANMGSITTITTLPGILKRTEVNDNEMPSDSYDQMNQSPKDNDDEIDETTEPRKVRIFSLPKINIYCEIEENPFDVGQIPEPSRPRDLIDDVPEDKMYAWLGFESQEQLDRIKEAKRAAEKRASSGRKHDPTLPKLEESPETPIHSPVPERAEIRPQTADLISTRKTVGTKEGEQDRLSNLSTDTEEEDDDLIDERFEVFDKTKLKKKKPTADDKNKVETIKLKSRATEGNTNHLEKLEIIPKAMHINSAREKFRAVVKTVLAVKYFNMLPPGREITSSKASRGDSGR